MRLRAYQRLYNQILDLFHQSYGVCVISVFEQSENKLKRSFRTDEISLAAAVGHETLAVLVNSVVSQVHLNILHVLFAWLMVRLGGEACEAVLEQKDAEGLHA